MPRKSNISSPIGKPIDIARADPTDDLEARRKVCGEMVLIGAKRLTWKELCQLKDDEKPPAA